MKNAHKCTKITASHVKKKKEGCHLLLTQKNRVCLFVFTDSAIGQASKTT